MSENLSLSVLESLAHMVTIRMMGAFGCVWVDIPEDAVIPFPAEELPSDWKAVPASQSTQQIGDNWYDKQASPVLKVPSTVNPFEFNFVLNPSHPEFQALIVGAPQAFPFDDRLLSHSK
jgi:RES domain-containing protein